MFGISGPIYNQSDSWLLPWWGEGGVDGALAGWNRGEIEEGVKLLLTETFRSFSVLLFFPTFRGIWCSYLLTRVLECFLNTNQLPSYWLAAIYSVTLIITSPSAFFLPKCCWFLLSAVFFLVSLFLWFFTVFLSEISYEPGFRSVYRKCMCSAYHVLLMYILSVTKMPFEKNAPIYTSQICAQAYLFSNNTLANSIWIKLSHPCPFVTKFYVP